MDWQEFEGEVRDLTEAFGYEAEATQPSNDHGVDEIAKNELRKVILQCKLYGSGKIGWPVLMQLLGAKVDFDAISGSRDRFGSNMETKLGLRARSSIA